MAIRRQFTLHYAGNIPLPEKEQERLKQRRATIEKRLSELGFEPHFEPLEKDIFAKLDYEVIRGIPAQARGGESEAPIYASEIDKFLYCQRSWWYGWRGEQSSQLPQMARGTKQHEGLAQQIQRVERATTNTRLFVWLIVLLIIITIGLRLFLG